MAAILAKFFVLIAGFLGLFSRYCEDVLVSFIVFLYPWLAPKELKRLRENTHVVLGLPPHLNAGKNFARQCLRHQMISNLHTLQELFANYPVDVQNEKEFCDYVAAHRKSDRGVVVITGHLGCWELAAKVTSNALGMPFSVLAKSSKLHGLSLFFNEVRRRAGVQVLWNHSKSLLREMLAVLKQRHALGFVMDQKPLNRIGYVTKFMGYQTEFVTGPAQMAKRGRAPILSVALVRMYGRTYRMRYEFIWDGDEELSEDQLTERMVRSMESTIRIYPEQWTWNYKRWKAFR